MKMKTENVEIKLRRNSIIILTLNCIFYIYTVVVFCLFLALDDEKRHHMYDIESLSKLLPLTILIVSVQILQYQIKSFKNEKMAARKRLITIHTVIFSWLILVIIGARVVDHYMISNESDPAKYCKYNLAFEFLSG